MCYKNVTLLPYNLKYCDIKIYCSYSLEKNIIGRLMTAIKYNIESYVGSALYAFKFYKVYLKNTNKFIFL